MKQKYNYPKRFSLLILMMSSFLGVSSAWLQAQTYNVTNTNTSGGGSLSDAIAQVSAGNYSTISVNGVVVSGPTGGAAITLSGNDLSINNISAKGTTFQTSFLYYGGTITGGAGGLGATGSAGSGGGVGIVLSGSNASIFNDSGQWNPLLNSGTTNSILGGAGGAGGVGAAGTGTFSNPIHIDGFDGGKGANGSAAMTLSGSGALVTNSGLIQGGVGGAGGAGGNYVEGTFGRGGTGGNGGDGGTAIIPTASGMSLVNNSGGTVQGGTGGAGGIGGIGNGGSAGSGGAGGAAFNISQNTGAVTNSGNIQGGTGGKGGDGGPFGTNAGGSGGTGGVAITFSGANKTITNNSGGTIRGGSGGNAGTSTLGGTGNGGSGGGAIVLLGSNGSLMNSGTVQGGSGGIGSTGAVGGAGSAGSPGSKGSKGGDGGTGNTAITLAGSNSIVTNSSGAIVLGGTGGIGGTGGQGGTGGGGGGTGGAGGDGGNGNSGGTALAILETGTFTNTSGVTIQGGTGGKGGTGGLGGVGGTGGFPGTGGRGGIGGTGGAALTLSLSNSTVVNVGTILGGTGGGGGAGGAVGAGGTGGTGIRFSLGSATVINSGTINGGLNGSTTDRANAIDFSGSGNRLEILDGSTIQGNVVVSGGGTNNTLALTGSVDKTFDASPYQGFDTFLKGGSNTLTLTGTNSFTGSTILSTGVLNLGSSGAIGASGALIFNGGTLQYSAANTTDYSSRFSGADNQVYKIDTNGQDIVLASNFSSNGGSLTKTGTGSLTLSGNNSYAGNTSINAGTLKLSGSNADTVVLIHNNAALDLGGGSRSIAGLGTSADAVVGNISNGTLSAGAGGIFLRSGTISATLTGSSATGRLWIGGDSNATVNLNGTNDMIFTADHHAVIIGHGTTGAAGTVKVGNANALAAATEEVQVFVGTLDLNGQTGVRAGNLVLAGNGNSYLINGSTGTAASMNASISLSTGNNVGGAGNLTLGGILSGGSLVKTGAGTLNLAGDNTYGGGTTINAGTLEIGSGTALGSGVITINGGIIRAAGALRTLDNALQLNGNFGLGRSTNFTGDITLGANITITSTNPDSSPAMYTSIIGGVIHDDNVTNHRSLTFDQGSNPIGTIVLDDANTYSGGTTLKAGILAAGNNQAFGTGKVTVSGGTLLVLKGFTIVNEVELTGGTLSRQLAGNGSLVHAADAISATGTEAEILAGSLSGSSSGTSTLDSSFSETPVSAASNDAIRLGDVYHFTGTGSDVFVLQLTVAGVDSNSTLGWFNGGAWVNAVDGNTGNNALTEMQGFNGTYAQFVALYSSFTLSQYIGAYGRDANSDTVWAVINHNSDFAVLTVPEPTTWVLLVAGLMVVVVGMAARRHQV